MRTSMSSVRPVLAASQTAVAPDESLWSRSSLFAEAAVAATRARVTAVLPQNAATARGRAPLASTAAKSAPAASSACVASAEPADVKTDATAASGKIPLLFCTFGSPFASRRIWTSSAFPLEDATRRGVSPLAFAFATSAPPCRRRRATATWPREHAASSGLSPFVLGASTLAPAARSCSRTGRCPYPLASQSGVVPMPFTASMSGFGLVARRMRVTSSEPLQAAAPSAQLPSASFSPGAHPAASSLSTAAVSFWRAAWTISVPCSLPDLLDRPPMFAARCLPEGAPRD
mmetsp:Transcript_51928/g.118422  ORF Transcript_51928/g.118422 Transcript_51928/m.118422 type:complete len:289 (-) Transcript_51928:16-882(-)